MTKTNKGAGARAAWLVESRKVLADLERLFIGESVQRLEFDDGEHARASALSAYERAKSEGGLTVDRFSDVRRLRLAAAQELSMRLHGDVHIFLQDSERRGVYKASAQAVARRAVELLEYDGSCVYVASDDDHKGALLDYEADALDGVMYELEAWG